MPNFQDLNAELILDEKIYTNVCLNSLLFKILFDKIYYFFGFPYTVFMTSGWHFDSSLIMYNRLYKYTLSKLVITWRIVFFGGAVLPQLPYFFHKSISPFVREAIEEKHG